MKCKWYRGRLANQALDLRVSSVVSRPSRWTSRAAGLPRRSACRKARKSWWRCRSCLALGSDRRRPGRRASVVVPLANVVGAQCLNEIGRPAGFGSDTWIEISTLPTHGRTLATTDFGTSFSPAVKSSRTFSPMRWINTSEPGLMPRTNQRCRVVLEMPSAVRPSGSTLQIFETLKQIRAGLSQVAPRNVDLLVHSLLRGRPGAELVPQALRRAKRRQANGARPRPVRRGIGEGSARGQDSQDQAMGRLVVGRLALGVDPVGSASLTDIKGGSPWPPVETWPDIIERPIFTNLAHYLGACPRIRH